MRRRAFFEVDKGFRATDQTAYKTKSNTREVICGDCGNTVYVDESTATRIADKINTTGDNAFLCEACIEDYEEAAGVL